jgi:hypothetical protein
MASQFPPKWRAATQIGLFSMQPVLESIKPHDIGAEIAERLYARAFGDFSRENGIC